MVQIGDYVIETDGQAEPTWCVRMAGAEEYISNHDTQDEAFEAVLRYRAADQRRRNSRIINAKTGKPVTRKEVNARFT